MPKGSGLKEGLCVMEPVEQSTTGRQKRAGEVGALGTWNEEAENEEVEEVK